MVSNGTRTTTVEATYRVVTPMFCGGADPKRTAELRLPSFKGALKFWWRALAWGRLGGSLRKIQQEEARLFGSADGGQSRVVMRLGDIPRVDRIDSKRILDRSGHAPHPAPRGGAIIGMGARYLGYGVMGAFGANAGKLERSCLAAPFGFTVHMRCRGLDHEELDSLLNALIALGALGGMGAKSRKGYGSLVLRSLVVDGRSGWRAPNSMGELQSTIRRLHGSAGSQRASISNARDVPYTALTASTRHVVATATAPSPLDLLDLIGRELVRFRAWGFNGNVLGNVPSENNFRDDHDLMKPSPGRRSKHPERIAFGLPHNYGKRSGEKVGPGESNLDRRASPLFIHIHECGGKPTAVLSLLPTKFLPGSKPQISVGDTRIPQRPEAELYKPVHEFLNRMTGERPHRGPSRQEPFTDVRKVDLP